MNVTSSYLGRKLSFFFALLSLYLLFLPMQAQARKIYVDNDYCLNGDCAWQGEWSWGCPPGYDACYCNLEEAIRNAASGDIVEIAPDTFQLCEPIYINNKNNLTIRGKTSKPTIYGNMSLEKSVIFEIYNSSNITIENLSLTYTYSHCIHISGKSNNFTLRNLNLKDAYESHIKINLTYGNGPFSDNGVIENCEIGYDSLPGTANFHVADVFGINISGVNGTIVRNCNIKNIKHPYYDPENPYTSIGWGVFAKGNAQDTIIEGNIIDNCGIGISFGNGGCDNGCPCRNNDCTYEHRRGIIRNNVVSNTFEYAIELNDSIAYKVYNNTLWSTNDPDNGNTTIDIRNCSNDPDSNIANNICSQEIFCRTHGTACLISRNNNIDMGNNLAGILFVNWANGDFHLKSTAIQAIDSGTNSVLSDVLTDMDGDVRPIGNTIDIGSDEYFYISCTDVDGDLYYSQAGCGTELDCNDEDPSVNPGAYEICNAVDDNCNGLMNEGGICVSRFGVYGDGLWALDTNANNQWDYGVDIYHSFGDASFIPVTGDWNGDGITDLGLYKDGSWFLDMNGNGKWDEGVDKVIILGDVGFTPVTGDWDGNGVTDIGLYKDGSWALDINSNGQWDEAIDKFYVFGDVGLIPVTGDWDGDGVTDIGVYKDGAWVLDMNGDGQLDETIDKTYIFGDVGLAPVTGDWNGDRVTNIGVYKDGALVLDMNGDGQLDEVIDKTYIFGDVGFFPLSGRW